MIHRLSRLSRFAIYNIIFAATAIIIMFLVWILGFVLPRSYANVPCSVTYTFVNGTIADAVQVNKNFSDVLTCFAGAAASGVNSDITVLTGLTTPLSVPQGGTGDTFITANGVLYGAGTAAINSTAAAPIAGLLSTNPSSVPTWMGPGNIGSVLAIGSTGFPTWSGVGTSGQVLTSVGAGEPVWATSNFSRSYTAITGNYTISSADCGHTLNLSGGYFTLTAGSAAAGPPCDVSFCNADAGTFGKHLVNFPAGFFSTLYPAQCGMITWGTGGWDAAVAPGRWMRSGINFYLAGAAGSDTANDGLDPSRPFATLGHCSLVARDQVYSTQSAPVVCHFNAGTTTEECVGVFGSEQSGNIYLLIQGDGSTSPTGWTCGAMGETGATLQVGDMAVVIVDNISIVAQGNSVPISLHNHGILDFGDTNNPQCQGATGPEPLLSIQGGNGTMIASDGSNGILGFGCSFTWGAGATCQSSGSSFLQAQNGIQVITAAGIKITNNNGRACGTFITSILGAVVYISGPITFVPPVGDAMYAGMRPYAVYGNSLIFNTADSGGTNPFPGGGFPFWGRTGTYCVTTPNANGTTITDPHAC